MNGSGVNRRAFLSAAGLGSAAVAGLPGLLEAAEWTATEKANVAVVGEMCRAWVAPLNFETIGGFLAEDCVFRASETSAPTLHDAPAEHQLARRRRVHGP